ncbi:MAG: anti-sigma factor [Chloroflexi bacterium]|nr:anti-sigma factor [Chloroflexota bacterium]
MNCHQAEELMPAYLLGALEEREKAELEAHISECPSCSALFHEHSAMTAMLSGTGEPVSPPPELRQRLMESLGTQAPPWTQAPERHRGGIVVTVRRSHVALAVAAMAISLAVLGAGTLLTWGELRELKADDSQRSESLQSQMHQVEEENQKLSEMLLDQWALVYMAAIPGKSTIMLEGEEASPQSRGMLMVSPTGTWGILAALRLEPLPDDRAYQLWLITDDNSRTSGGVFTVDDTGYGLLEIRSQTPLTAYQALGVSVEPATGSPGPTGVKVLGGRAPSTSLP